MVLLRFKAHKPLKRSKLGVENSARSKLISLIQFFLQNKGTRPLWFRLNGSQWDFVGLWAGEKGKNHTNLCQSSIHHQLPFSQSPSKRKTLKTISCQNQNYLVKLYVNQCPLFLDNRFSTKLNLYDSS